MATATLSPERLRADFPLLADGGPGVVYLDSAATSQKPASVLAAMDAYYREANANVHRGVYGLAVEATDRFESARDAVAGLVGVDREQVVFTKNASEALNLMAWAWGVRNLDAGDEILVTAMEHHSNIVPWQLVAKHTGAELAYLHLDEDYQLDISDLDAVFDDRTKVLGISGMSNVTGAIPPLAELIAAAHRVGAIVVVDGAQAVPHMPVDVATLGADFLAFSAHKMLGPTGIGVLWGKTELLEEMEPADGGGEMISDVQLYESRWAPVPHKFEAGTPPIAQAVGFGAAVDYLGKLGMQDVRKHELEITGYALERLSEIPGLTVHGPSDLAKRGGAVSFTLGDIHAHDLATILDEEAGVAIRAGHHCAKPLMREMAVNSTARASFYVYTIEDDIDRLVYGLHRAREVFGL